MPEKKSSPPKAAVEQDKIASKKPGLGARRTALEVLIKVEQNAAYTNIALSSAFKDHNLSDRDRAFATALVQGVVRHLSEIDSKLSKISKQPLKKMPVTLRNLLRMAIFQLDQMPDMPPSAIVKTAGELARITGHPGQVSFTNGVLRNYIRQTAKPSAASLDATTTSEDDLSSTYSLPDWLIERWRKRFGEKETQALAQFSQQIPKLTVRCCELALTSEALKNVFESKGMRVSPGKLVSSCLTLEDRGKFKGPIKNIPGYKDGFFVVQDEASAFVAVVVAPKPGQLVIDLCAAPGGKSLHMAELMEGKGRIVAVDIKESRLDLLKDTRQRLGLTNIEVAASDGREFAADAPADCVLVDAPCTGTGVMNRRADLRFQRQLPDLEALVTLQRELLDAASKLVKPGGTLVYSTCSIENEENEDNIKWFCQTHKDFVVDSLMPFIPQTLQEEWAKDKDFHPESGCLQLLPSRHGLSGFFICRLKKLSS